MITDTEDPKEEIIQDGESDEFSLEVKLTALCIVVKEF